MPEEKKSSDLPNGKEMFRRMAAAVRQACIEVAIEAYQQAKLSGLCQEGAWELAVDAMRSMNLDEIIDQVIGQAPGSASSQSVEP